MERRELYEENGYEVFVDFERERLKKRKQKVFDDV